MAEKLTIATDKADELKLMIDEAFSIIQMVEFNLVPVSLTWKDLTHLKEYLKENENNPDRNVEKFKKYENSEAWELKIKKRMRLNDVREAKYDHLDKSVEELEKKLRIECAKTDIVQTHLDEMEQTTKNIIGHLVMTQLGVCINCIDPFFTPMHQPSVKDRIARNIAVVRDRESSKGKFEALSEEFIKKHRVNEISELQTHKFQWTRDNVQKDIPSTETILIEELAEAEKRAIDRVSKATDDYLGRDPQGGKIKHRSGLIELSSLRNGYEGWMLKINEAGKRLLEDLKAVCNAKLQGYLYSFIKPLSFLILCGGRSIFFFLKKITLSFGLKGFIHSQ